MNKEIWKSIKGFENNYEVSTEGRIRSLDRIGKSRWGTPKQIKGAIKTLNLQPNGYLLVQLWKNGKGKHFSVHRLVALNFLPLIEGKNIVNHKDGIKTNNFLENLEWCTTAENHKHAVKMNLHPFGTKHPRSVLTKDDIIKIKELVEIKKISRAKVAKLFKVSKATICYMLLGKTYSKESINE